MLPPIHPHTRTPTYPHPHTLTYAPARAHTHTHILEAIGCPLSRHSALALCPVPIQHCHPVTSTAQPPPPSSRGQTHRPAPHSMFPDSHLALVPRPWAWAPRDASPTRSQGSGGPIVPQVDPFTACTPGPQPRAHLPQHPRGFHSQPAAPLHLVHRPICASPLSQDFTTQKDWDKRAGGEALLVGLRTERQ